MNQPGVMFRRSFQGTPAKRQPCQWQGCLLSEGSVYFVFLLCAFDHGHHRRGLAERGLFQAILDRAARDVRALFSLHRQLLAARHQRRKRHDQAQSLHALQILLSFPFSGNFFNRIIPSMHFLSISPCDCLSFSIPVKTRLTARADGRIILPES